MFKTTARFAASLASAGAMALAAPLAAHNHDHDSTPNIVQAAASNDNFETLVAAVQAADLAGTLSGDGPFTVFAPTDTAFDALPTGTVDTLLQPANRGALTDILTYHVVAGRVTADDLIHLIRDGDGHARISTLNGETLIARLNNGQVVLTDAADRQVLVTQTDIGTSNGVIHVLDRVLLPG
ncbi:fasciclin domain-containing protein [Aurantiacibacter aquimixticola]|uniref:Fasciclin domain-containing protein n=1 Tax=Aurantiacibacter aquimixticola TaxID=1958945 RepID=A0A419RWS4_9SPHN|nr:fasciclin domain-containing protein [Aurantiacibacter aquimixticola]RJY10246.1 fasciclin domain-containing protein [Aurantiacibacter aquimixticola]